MVPSDLLLGLWCIDLASGVPRATISQAELLSIILNLQGFHIQEWPFNAISASLTVWSGMVNLRLNECGCESETIAILLLNKSSGTLLDLLLILLEDRSFG